MSEKPIELESGKIYPVARTLKPFNLVDDKNASFTNEQLKGHWTLTFFGYTYCPDVCPGALNTSRHIIDKLGKQANKLTVLLVSVDPERDSPERLHDYVTYFHPDFRAATGSEDELKKFTRQMGVAYIKEEPDEKGFYLVDHTAAFLLFDPQGRLYAIFPAPHDPEAMSRDLVILLESGL